MNNTNNIMKQFFAACALMLGIATMGLAQEVVNGPAMRKMSRSLPASARSVLASFSSCC